MIAGLEEISEGSIYLDGVLLNDLDPKDRNISMVFQNYALYPHLSVKNNIAFPLKAEKYGGFKHYFSLKYRKERRQRIDQAVKDAAEKINLTPYLNRKPANLSGGQRQRVALGRAIVRNPKVFLLDEPLSNLDAKMRVEMRSEISRLHKELNTVFIYVTHDQVEAMTMGDKIVVLKDGVIQQINSPKELFLNPVNMFVAGFIGTPQMNFFEGMVSKVGTKYYAKFDNFGDKILLPLERVKQFPEEKLNQNVIIGLRPKAIKTEGDYGYINQNIKAKVTLVEQLGEDTLLYVLIKGNEKEVILSTTGLDRFQNNDVINISFDATSVCIFDKETEKTLL